MKIALFSSTFSPQTIKTETQIITICKALYDRKAEVYLSYLLLGTFSKKGRAQLEDKCIAFYELPIVDIVLSVGGDGTFLRTAKIIDRTGIPILGINTGRLGFLADINFNDLEETLNELFSNNYLIEPRMLLEVKYDAKTEIQVNHPKQFALNEVAILKQDTSSMLTLHTFIDNDFLTSYQADGLIISTPTGSTAYSLSVGGPILMPQSSSIVLSPIAPHNLTSRPLVVNHDVTIRIKTESRSNTFLISTDGNSETFETPTEIIIQKAEHTLNVVKRIGHTFYGTLRDKLLWGVDVRR